MQSSSSHPKISSRHSRQLGTCPPHDVSGDWNTPGAGSRHPEGEVRRRRHWGASSARLAPAAGWAAACGPACRARPAAPCAAPACMRTPCAQVPAHAVSQATSPAASLFALHEFYNALACVPLVSRTGSKITGISAMLICCLSTRCMRIRPVQK